MLRDNTIKNIEIVNETHDCNDSIFKEYLENAINFLKSELNNEFSCNLKIIITEKYDDEINKHIKYIPNIHENACLINRFSNSNRNTNEKDIMIINWDNCCNLGNTLFESILVHELIHHVDFMDIVTINQLYSVNIFSEDELMNDKEKSLNFFFLARTELRAFYYDEKYLLNRNERPTQINQISEIGDDNYSLKFALPRLLGKVKLWSERNLETNIDEANNYINTASEYGKNWGNNIANSFKFDSFICLCEQINRYFDLDSEL